MNLVIVKTEYAKGKYSFETAIIKGFRRSSGYSGYDVFMDGRNTWIYEHQIVEREDAKNRILNALKELQLYDDIFEVDLQGMMSANWDNERVQNRIKIRDEFKLCR